MYTTRKKRRWPKLVVFVSMIFLGVYATVGLLPKPAVANNDASSIIESAQTTATAKTTSVDTTTMDDQINAIISQYPELQISVAITDISTGQTYDYGVKQAYVGASTIKLLTASLYLHEVEEGRLTLSQGVNGTSAKYQLQQLIEQSDNNAWAALDEMLGTTELQAWGDELGLTSYDASTKIINTQDMAALLTKLYKNELLNQTNTDLLLSYMKDANYTNFIKSAVPSGVNVYHKAGFLDDRIHDAAIIDNGKDPYVLVIFSKSNSGIYDIQTGEDLFHAITTSTLETFVEN